MSNSKQFFGIKDLTCRINEGCPFFESRMVLEGGGNGTHTTIQST